MPKVNKSNAEKAIQQSSKPYNQVQECYRKAVQMRQKRQKLSEKIDQLEKQAKEIRATHVPKPTENDDWLDENPLASDDEKDAQKAD